MELIEIIKQDYQNFPDNQTYSIYSENIYFKDPVYNFYGLRRYQNMIKFISKWFANLKLELHDIKRNDNLIETKWTMSWNSPFPWKPFISVSGRSELQVNQENLIISHIDYWDCSKWDVIKQHFPFNS
jgi:hypothetical protein